MSWKHSFVAAATLIATACWLQAGEPQQPTAEPQPQPQASESLLFPGGDFGSADDLSFLARGQSPYYVSESAARFGWWGVSNSGSPVKTGEWQSLQSSPFWDFDHISSDGVGTLDLTATGTDDETTAIHAYGFMPGYFGKGVSVDVDYDRFIHRLDHKPLVNDDGLGHVLTDDLNVGDDYAIRVQEFETKFKGRISENLKWRLNLWGMSKRGERQVRTTAHCLDDSVCHVQSQGQRIDWTTVEIEPVIEAKVGPITAEYSRTMRLFEQDDQVVQAPFNHFGFDGDYDYALVPDTYTQFDRMKFGADLTPCTDFYANLFRGDTENKFRDTHRGYYGVDMRVTNRSIRGLALSGYAKWEEEKTTLPDEFLVPGATGPIPPYGEPINDLMVIGGDRFSDMRHPVNRRRHALGFDARWRPGFKQWSSYGLSIDGGYEYSELERTNTNYGIADTDFPTRPPAPAGGFFVQPNTYSHLFHIGTSRRWSSCFDTYIRYKLRFDQNPLYGVREADENYPGYVGTVTNTSLPEHTNLVEIGGTWTPTYNFLLSAMFGLENLSTNNAEANFDENNYPLVVSAWYAPTERLSFSGGYAYFSNFIDQDITVGFRALGGTNPTVTTPWDYRGHAQVFNIGSRYQCTERLRLTGDVEWVRGTDLFSTTSAAGTNFSAIPYFSDVVVETTRFDVGVDYWLWDRVNCFFRYNYFDYEDGSVAYNSGTAHMFLGGISATF